ncbi:hypothetical protein [Thermus hydrothermalis]|uniref:hypothetical protein n=1 Tax=Thermus hydrothermalis TaxID=2908148 RepID=UPI001FAB0F77|nr:hypothetical protein [Thermus hydrothermalis]
MPFGLSESYFPSLSGYTPPYTLLDSGGSGSSGFGLSYSYTMPLTGGVPGSAGDTPLWAQILSGLGQLSSFIDPYILTEQERLQYQLQLAQAQAEAARAAAQPTGVQVQPAGPSAWVWVLGGLLVLLLVVILLKE